MAEWWWWWWWGRLRLALTESLLDDTAAGGRVVSVDFVLVAVDVVGVSVSFPLVLHLGDGDQLHRLSLGGGLRKTAE